MRDGTGGTPMAIAEVEEIRWIRFLNWLTPATYGDPRHGMVCAYLPPFCRHHSPVSEYLPRFDPDWFLKDCRYLFGPFGNPVLIAHPIGWTVSRFTATAGVGRERWASEFDQYCLFRRAAGTERPGRRPEPAITSPGRSWSLFGGAELSDDGVAACRDAAFAHPPAWLVGAASTSGLPAARCPMCGGEVAGKIDFYGTWLHCLAYFVDDRWMVGLGSAGCRWRFSAMRHETPPLSDPWSFVAFAAAR